MSKSKEKARALKMRLQGKSYSQIRETILVSKSTLSTWLRDFPLTEARIRELRADSPRRIERYRETRRKNRQKVIASTHILAKQDIGALSPREQFLMGLSLYWAEGTKGYGAITSLANTDPSMIRFFLKWLLVLDVPQEKIRVRLHLYADMDIEKETRYWMHITGISRKQFRKPYVKQSKLSELTYTNGHGHGTCNISYGNRALNDYVLESIRVIRNPFEK